MALSRVPVAWYGDDFTGSTDVMEVLAMNGLPSVLFLGIPDHATLERFGNMRAIGIAGDARSRPPAWMDEHLAPCFRFLRDLGADLVHYKVCSTFDSSPDKGSIGRALEIGRTTLDSRLAVPIVVGAPALRRYCTFGNLFAAVGEETFRLDRHPTMSRHPVTPMAESDLRRHLAVQTPQRVALFDVLALWANDYRQRFRRLLAEEPDAILFDVVDAVSLARCGELIWEEVRAARFAVASSGLQYALTSYWKASGMLDAPDACASVPAVDRLVVVSGSCSPVTAKQIREAQASGWKSVAADPQRLAQPATRSIECDRLEESALAALESGKSVVVHTACGPDDPRVHRFNDWLRLSDPMIQGAANANVGGALGDLLRSLIERVGIERAIVAGGDTSSASGAPLGIDALTFIAPTSPGSPLCRAHAREGPLDGISIVFKGGQVGGPGYFEAVRQGHFLPSTIDNNARTTP
ncbi:MAG: four-carbon acid sugar kinase family protein [Acidimicrobiia bacterium]